MNDNHNRPSPEQRWPLAALAVALTLIAAVALTTRVRRVAAPPVDAVATAAAEADATFDAIAGTAAARASVVRPTVTGGVPATPSLSAERSATATALAATVPAGEGLPALPTVGPPPDAPAATLAHP